MLDGGLRTSPIPPPFRRPCQDCTISNNKIFIKLIQYPDHLVECGDDAHPQGVAGPLLDGLLVQHGETLVLVARGLAVLRRVHRVNLDQEVVLQEHEAHDGEEVDQDDGEDEGEDDGADIPRHGSDHILEGFLLRDEVN